MCISVQKIMMKVVAVSWYSSMRSCSSDEKWFQWKATESNWNGSW